MSLVHDRCICLRNTEYSETFQIDLLRESGYLAELFACVQCGSSVDRWELVYFSPSRGGVVCRNCEGATPDRIQIDVRLLRLLQGVLRLPRNERGNGALRLPQ